MIGVLCITAGPLMLICALVDLAADNPDWQIFVLSAVLTVGFGMLLSTATWSGPFRLSLRQGFLLTVLAWVVMSLIGSVPLYFSSLPISYAGAFFEGVSGFTSTGATVVSGLETLPPGLLLWRGLMQWVGGLGVIALGIVLLPFLRISGMQLFRMESSDVSDKATARVVVLLRQITFLYFALTVAGLFGLLALGLSPLDAAVHAMTGIATGGFANYDSSIGAFDSFAVELVLAVLMFLGALTFPLMVLVFHGRPDAIWRDEQIRFFIMLVLAVTAVMSLWRVLAAGVRLEDALWPTFFNVLSVISTTGFASDNYVAWGPFPEMLFFLITYIGGCTGSTAGGIKPYRLLLLGKMARNQILTRLQPHRIVRITYNERIVDDEIVRSVSAFVWVFVLSLVAFTAAVSACGIDFVTAISAVSQALANVGPGIGPVIGPAGNYATLPEAALWLLSAAMLLGRLEVVVVLVVLSPAFWRR